MADNIIQELLKPIAEGKDLSFDQAVRAFQIMLNGGATPAQMGAFLMGLSVKGESVEEIAAGAEVLRVKSLKIQAPPGTMDVCGTGGDGTNSLNISTAVALTVASCGVKVAKHGNRAVSSKSGSADVLAELGVNINATPAVAQRCLEEAGICFMLAPVYHPCMRHITPVRQELAIRTVFNLLGPLANPASPDYQLVGVFSRAWVRPMTEVLQRLGCKRALIVHGADGGDELNIAGISYVAELRENEIEEYTLSPESFGMQPQTDSLKGGDAAHNAQALREVLMGMKGAYHDAVVLNAAAALMIAGKANTLPECANLATEALNSGAAYKVLQNLIAVSHEHAH